ncbi:28S ribosomal protein S31, mitochondrial isoform X2 [Nannospalax galili]|uniref:28S ribosomal protein S31, mitochondrial isoform X2 n=1 Tax=Nannospalax galili TaxID=1026970 RepID=UPI0004ED11D6|nr:28S ribosomal protein S31, mitochondrial isoform X2 [Nannospalax galili]
MLPRVSVFLPVRPFSGLSLSSGSREASGAVSMPFAALTGTVRTENNIQRYFGISSVIYNKKDKRSVPASEISKKTLESPGREKETMKKGLLDIIKGMKVESSTATVQTKPSHRKPHRSLETKIDGLQRATEDAPKKGNEPLSPELVAAASAVAESLPFDRQTTKSELLKQLQQHEEESRAQQEREKSKISFSNIISDMKIAKPSSTRVSRRPEHQIQFDEESDNLLDKEKTTDRRKGKNIFKGKRLNIFDIKSFTDEAPEPVSPSLWEIEFAKQLATVNEQPIENGFEEMIQWTKEGKLWEFPLNNEASFDDDGSEFHEHIFLDKHLEGFPKQGPIRHFMELVTCGLSKNPYLSVKQKVEHIEWFRNYFNEKRDILKESNIQFT